jgi:hypothetical protein
MVGEDGSGQSLAVPLSCLLILVVLSSGLSSNILQVRPDRHNISRNAETADPDTEHSCWLAFRRPAGSLSQTSMPLSLALATHWSTVSDYEGASQTSSQGDAITVGPL